MSSPDSLHVEYWQSDDGSLMVITMNSPTHRIKLSMPIAKFLKMSQDMESAARTAVRYASTLIMNHEVGGSGE